MKAMIFAAGLGTRLKPLTDNLPKALAPLAGRTLLYHLLMRLHDAGVGEFVINVHHFAPKIISYVADTPELAALNISFSDERDMLRDTGGGIRFARPLLMPEDPTAVPRPCHKCHNSGYETLQGHDQSGRFLVHNVDIVSDLDIRRLESQAHPESLATLLVSRRETKRYLLFDEGMRLVGWINIATGEVKTPFCDIDIRKCHRLAFGGIHLISNDIFKVFDEIDNSPEDYPLYDSAGAVIPASRQPLGKCFPIMDFYLRAAAAWPIYAAAPASLTLIDSGKLETLAAAEKFVRTMF